MFTPTKYKSFADAYSDLIKYLNDYGKYVNKDSEKETREIRNISFTITDPRKNLFEGDVRSSKLKYICAELLWYFSGDTSINWISKFASLWKNIADENNQINSNYGYLVYYNPINCTDLNSTQFRWASQSLLSDNNSRQAVIHFNSPVHQYKNNKDFVCTMYTNFHIRDNKLHMNVHMRSSDIIFGIPNDIVFFSILQQDMLSTLNRFGDRNFELGELTFNTDSIHVYKRHYNTLSVMSNDVMTADSLVLAKSTDSITMLHHAGNYVMNGVKNSDNQFINYLIDNAENN